VPANERDTIISKRNRFYIRGMRIAYLMDHDKLLILATPYYEKGRPGDLQHIAWLQRRLIELKRRIDDAGHDFEVTYAVTILHDIGLEFDGDLHAETDRMP
jgi:hypothetical protein